MSDEPTVKVQAGLTMDRDVVFKDVPDRDEMLGRTENQKQHRALVHDPGAKKGKRWRHKGKSSRAAKMEESIRRFDP